MELVWTGALHPGWNRLGALAAPTGPGPQIHGLHLPALPWGAALGDTALDVLRPGLGADFLVLHATALRDRSQTSAFLAVLEGLLEMTQGSGLKLALRPDPGAVPSLVGRLREVRGEAVGFCWDAQMGGDLDAVADRLFCAVGTATDDFRPIQRLGYRWNVAIPAQDPATHRQEAASILRTFPPVLFPEQLDQDLPAEQGKERP